MKALLLAACLLLVPYVACAEFTDAEKAEVKQLTNGVAMVFDATDQATKAMAAAGAGAREKPFLQIILGTGYLESAQWHAMGALSLLYEGQPSVSQSGRDAYKALTRPARVAAAWDRLDSALVALRRVQDRLVGVEQISTNSTFIARLVNMRDVTIPRAIAQLNAVDRKLTYTQPRLPNPPNIPQRCDTDFPQNGMDCGQVSTMVGPHGDWDDGSQNKWRSWSYTWQTYQNFIQLYKAEPLDNYAKLAKGIEYTAMIGRQFTFNLAKQALIQIHSTDSEEKFFAALQRKRVIDEGIPFNYFQLSRVIADIALLVDGKPVASKALAEAIKNIADSWFRLDAHVNWLGYDQFPYCERDFPAGCAGQQR